MSAFFVTGAWGTSHFYASCLTSSKEKIHLRKLVMLTWINKLGYVYFTQFAFWTQSHNVYFRARGSFVSNNETSMGFKGFRVLLAPKRMRQKQILVVSLLMSFLTYICQMSGGNVFLIWVNVYSWQRRWQTSEFLEHCEFKSVYITVFTHFFKTVVKKSDNIKL